MFHPSQDSSVGRILAWGTGGVPSSNPGKGENFSKKISGQKDVFLRRANLKKKPCEFLLEQWFQTPMHAESSLIAPQIRTC